MSYMIPTLTATANIISKEAARTNSLEATNIAIARTENKFNGVAGVNVVLVEAYFELELHNELRRLIQGAFASRGYYPCANQVVAKTAIQYAWWDPRSLYTCNDD